MGLAEVAVDLGPLRKEAREFREQAAVARQAAQELIGKKWKGIRVLVVDDEPAICEVLELLFDREGIQAYSAPDTEYALYAAKGVRPDFIVLDVAGVGAFEDIVLEFGDRVVIFSAWANDRSRIPDWVRNSVRAVIPKPGTIDVVAAVKAMATNGGPSG